ARPFDKRFSPFAVRKLIGREALVERPRPRQGRGVRVKFGSALVIFIFLLIKPGKRFVEIGAIWIILYSAFEEILAQAKIFTLRFDSQRKTWMVLIVHRGNAGVPCHVPGRR